VIYNAINCEEVWKIASKLAYEFIR